MQTQYLHLTDGTIAFDDQGKGPLILCMPAGGDLRSEYRFLTPRLVAAGYRVVTMDVRGQGESSAYWPDYTASALGSDMLALLEHLDAGPAIIIGTSKAAGAAIWASVEAPDRVSGLVLIGTFARAASPLRALLLARLLLAPLWGKAVYFSFFPTMYPSSRPADFEEHFDKVKAMLKEPGRLRALRIMFSDTGEDWDTRVSQVKTPVLILMGSRDPDFKQPEQEAYLLAKRLQATQATVQIIEGAGHHPQAEMPEQVAQSVLTFLAEREQKTLSSGRK
jgi:pimeloyl-ACP methyl ester carboxylesterase